MFAVDSRLRALTLAVLSVGIGCVQALAGPLPLDAEPLPSPPAVSGWIPLSETELVLSDPRFDPSPDPAAPGAATRLPPGAQARGGRAGTAPQDLPSGWDNVPGLDSGAVSGAAAVRDALRSFVNVQRGSPGAEGPPMRRGGGPPDGLGLAGVDLGPAANEWIQETVKGILDSALRLEVNERGQTSFSVFGLGDFSVSVSGDRSEVALVSGDEVMLSARRTQPHAGGASGGHAAGPGGGDWRSSGQHGGGAGATSDAADSPLRQALELAAEIASHPLSLLVYALIGIYALVWSVLSRQAQRPLGRAVAAHEWRHPEPLAARKHRLRTRNRPRRRHSSTGGRGH